MKFNAIVLIGSIQKSLANMYFLFSKPNIESKVFNNIDEALKWLKEGLGK